MRMDHFFNDLLSKNKKSTGCALLGILHKRFYVKYLKHHALLFLRGFVAKIPKTMILLYLFFIKIFLNSLKISILQNIYATKPIHKSKRSSNGNLCGRPLPI